MDLVKTAIGAHVALVFYTVAAFGLAYIVGHAKISLRFRERVAGDGEGPGAKFINFLECPACFGFWEGVFVGVFVAGARGMAFFGWALPAAFCLGLYTCGANFIIGRLTRLIPE